MLDFNVSNLMWDLHEKLLDVVDKSKVNAHWDPQQISIKLSEETRKIIVINFLEDRVRIDLKVEESMFSVQEIDPVSSIEIEYADPKFNRDDVLIAAIKLDKSIDDLPEHKIEGWRKDTIISPENPLVQYDEVKDGEIKNSISIDLKDGEMQLNINGDTFTVEVEIPDKEES